MTDTIADAAKRYYAVLIARREVTRSHLATALAEWSAGARTDAPLVEERAYREVCNYLRQMETQVPTLCA